MTRYGWWVLGLAAGLACRGGKADPARGGGAALGGGPAGLPVEVVAARRDTVRDEVAATGEIEAMQAIELRPEVEGRIVAILFREGEEVAAGAPLVQVDSAELAAQVAQLAAQRDLAEQDLARTRELVREHAASAADLERAEATARAAEAQYRLQSTRLARTTVRAPFAGLAGQRFVSIGDYVTPATRLVTLQTVSPQRAAFAIPERFARAVRPGQRVALRVGAIPGRDFAGTVDFVDPRVQLPSRTILVKALVPNPGRLLAPGMFIEARLVTGVRSEAVVVPEDAVVSLEGGAVVWVAAGGKAERRTVRLGVRAPGWVEVADGVRAGEQVVVGGLELLAPGVPVVPKVVERRP
jgi:membrane fusion protein (multidrug efflux system)